MPAARQLRNRPELHTDHQDQDRAQGKRPSRQEAVCQGHQNLRPSDDSTQLQTTHFAAEVELHIASIQEWEIIFASVLVSSAMALREELTVAGAFLFRWRSYFPLGALVLVVSQMRHVAHGGARYPDSLPWGALCLVVALAGLGVRAYVAGHVPQGTSGRNTRSQICEGLNTDGAYSMVRHPLYLGNFLIWLGVALVPRSAWLLLLVTAAFWIYYERIMYAEEEFLRNKFGERYLFWARTTPAFLPNPRLFRRPSLPFSLRTVLRRECSSWFGVIASFALLETMANSSAHGRLGLGAGWTTLVTICGLTYVALRCVKRRTHWLDVAGR